MKKKISYLTIDQAVERLEAVKAAAGTGDVPFLAQSQEPRMLELCDLVLRRAGSTDLYRLVSRGGVPVVVVSLYAPQKPFGSPKPYLNVDEAIDRLRQLRQDVPGDTPVLADAKGRFATQPCDIREDRHAAGGFVYKTVSRGGRPVGVVTFGPPVLA